MSNFPYPRLNKGIISSLSPEAGQGEASFASAVWPTTSAAFFIPIHVKQDFHFTTMFWANGTAVSGNVDMGIYSAPDATRLYSTGLTAQAGVSTLQTVAKTGFLSPGNYYLAIGLDNGVGTIWKQAPGVANCIWLGMSRMASGIALPATATLTVAANSNIPLCGITNLPTI